MDVTPCSPVIILNNHIRQKSGKIGVFAGFRGEFSYQGRPRFVENTLNPIEKEPLVE
jgi:hypothetical protein